ncbi:TPA: hypothetical protein P0P67_002639 [Staphylococcus aureus]|nr:hypothetical protein [Staphylococcus aureus]
MKLENNQNFELIELEGLFDTYGNAIDLDFRGHQYSFTVENDHIIVNMDSDNKGYLWFAKYDNPTHELKFEDWDNDKAVFVTWLDELATYLNQRVA